jgi:putative sterol carrier protein
VPAGERVEAWSVMIDKGDIAVSNPGDRGTADCVIRADRELFDRIFSGDANSMAALLRGALLADGDPELLIAARRLLPAAAGAKAVGKEDRS